MFLILRLSPCFDLGSDMNWSIVWVIMGRRGVSSERRRSSCSSCLYEYSWEYLDWRDDCRQSFINSTQCSLVIYCFAQVFSKVALSVPTACLAWLKVMNTEWAGMLMTYMRSASPNHMPLSAMTSRPSLNIKTISPGNGISITKIRWSWDHLIFIITFPTAWNR